MSSVCEVFLLYGLYHTVCYTTSLDTLPFPILLFLAMALEEGSGEFLEVGYCYSFAFAFLAMVDGDEGFL